jgi:hypothetical protein
MQFHRNDPSSKSLVLTSGWKSAAILPKITPHDAHARHDKYPIMSRRPYDTAYPPILQEAVAAGQAIDICESFTPVKTAKYIMSRESIHALCDQQQP